MMRLASSGPLTASSRSLAVSAAVLNLEYLVSSSYAGKTVGTQHVAAEKFEPNEGRKVLKKH